MKKLWLTIVASVAALIVGVVGTIAVMLPMTKKDQDKEPTTDTEQTPNDTTTPDESENPGATEDPGSETPEPEPVKHTVYFIYQDQLVNTAQITDGQKATAPDLTEVADADYQVDGWLVNGTVVDLTTYAVNANTVFIAKLSLKTTPVVTYTVNFVYQDKIVKTAEITAGQKVTAPDLTAVADADYDFDGWTVNDTVVDLTTYAVNANTVFIAKLTSNVAPVVPVTLHTVTFQYDDTNVFTQEVKDGNTATAPDVRDQAPIVKDGLTYNFYGWTLDGTTLADLTAPVTAAVNYRAMFQYTGFVADDINTINDGYDISRNVWYDGQTTYYSCGDLQYVLQDGQWQALTTPWQNEHGENLTLYGSYIWYDNNQTYLTYWSSTDNAYKHYRLGDDGIWYDQVWTGSPNDYDYGSYSFADYIVNVGTDTYYIYDQDNCYKLDRETDTWAPFTFKFEDEKAYFYGYEIWQAYGRTYMISSLYEHFVLDGDTWKSIAWETDNYMGRMTGDSVFNIGGITYAQYRDEYYFICHRLDPITLCWEMQPPFLAWAGFIKDDDNGSYYYSSYDDYYDIWHDAAGNTYAIWVQYDNGENTYFNYKYQTVYCVVDPVTVTE